jgi:hypothetical protein
VRGAARANDIAGAA